MSIKSKAQSLGLAMLMVLAGTAAALAVPAWATSPVNVREGPSTSSYRIDTLRRGERVDIDYCRGSWCFVERRGGPDGWVSASYLSRDRYDDDDYYEPPRYERPRPRWYRPYRPFVNSEFCVGNPNARFCIGSGY